MTHRVEGTGIDGDRTRNPASMAMISVGVVSGPRTLPHLAHWGAFRVTVEDDEIVGIGPHPDDPAPSPLHENFRDGLRRGRVARPSVRRGWLEHGPGPDSRRGSDRYVEVPWDEALDLAANEIRRVRDEQRQRGDLRRLVRLGQCRSVPPCAEPVAPVPELRRRLHGVGQLVLAGRVRGAAPTRHRLHRCALPGHHVVRHPRPHRPRRRLRGHEHQERLGGARRRHPAHAGAGPGRGRHAWSRVRAVQPSPRRPTGRGGVDVAPDPTRHRHRRHAGAGPRPAERGSGRPRLPRALHRRVGATGELHHR